MRMPAIGRAEGRGRMALALLLPLLAAACGDQPQADAVEIRTPGVRLPSAPPADPYGGVARRVAPPSGHFSVKQVGTRWLFVTPEGNGMWLLGVFSVIYSSSVDDLGTSGQSRVAARYGGEPAWQDRWRQFTVKRLKAWGFNALAEYHHWTLRAGPQRGANPERIPFIHIIKPAYYGLTNSGRFGTGPFKDLIVGTDERYYTGYRGSHAPDFFDPAFEAYVDGWMRKDDGLAGQIGNPWMLGISMDDADNLFGFGPGAEMPAARLHPHLGWIVLVTNFEQAGSPMVATYSDTRVYSKYALRDFLASKYGTVEALNQAWGSRYTSLDSDGGWGRGTGLLDENGRNPWVGNERDDLAGVRSQLRADLDQYLYLYARRYFSVMAGKMRQYAPQHLVFGPASLNQWGGLTRKEVLRAAGESVDVVQCAVATSEALDRTARYVGNKPLVIWTTFIANPDSALWRYPVPVESPQIPPLARTQQERGRMYAAHVEFAFNATGSQGVHPVAGIKFWSWGDNWADKVNFGLVTFSENAYDGREAMVARATDPWGFPTGGEERNYGDFLSAVVGANLAVQQRLAAMTR